MKAKETISEQDLAKISKFARKEMTAEEIYTFPLILCDNEIDRDKEKFTVESLEKLAKLFVGKTGIFDHDMSSKDQSARVYSTSVETDPTRKTADGEVYTYIKAKAYMVRTDKNKDLIAEIDAGIKKETSVGCSVKSVRCSICGRDIKSEGCEHRKGRMYEGKMCCYLLCEPEDAYEWSFVAVPAQKNAGVVKSFTPDSNQEIMAMYRADMKASITKNAGTVFPAFCGDILERVCACLPVRELRDLNKAFEQQARKSLPLVRQLAPETAGKKETTDEYLI